jgi:hypothetical protein
MTGGAEATINAGTSYLFPVKTSAAFAAKLLTECFGQVCGYTIEPIFGSWYLGQFILLLITSIICLVVIAQAACCSTLCNVCGTILKDEKDLKLESKNVDILVT